MSSGSSALQSPPEPPAPASPGTLTSSPEPAWHVSSPSSPAPLLPPGKLGTVIAH